MRFASDTCNTYCQCVYVNYIVNSLTIIFTLVDGEVTQDSEHLINPSFLFLFPLSSRNTSARVMDGWTSARVMDGWN